MRVLSVSPLLLLLCVALTSYRLARFLIADEMFAGTRINIVNRLTTGKDKLWRRKIKYLIGCPYCVTAYTTLLVMVLVDQFAVVPLPWLFGFAAWGGSLACWRYIEND